MSIRTAPSVTTKPPPGAMVDWTHPLSRGLVAWWLFNEGAGSQADDIVGRNDGTLTNGPAWRGGKFGSALSFDGSNDYVNLSPITVSKVPLSWCALVYPTSFATHKNPLAQTGNDALETFGLFIWQTSGQAAVQLGTNSFNGNNLTLNKWACLCGTTDGTTGRLYQDGVQTASGSDGRTEAAATGFNVGRSTGSGRYFSGLIDEVRIYNRALSAFEVAQLYVAPFANLLAPRRLVPVGAAVRPWDRYCRTVVGFRGDAPDYRP